MLAQSFDGLSMLVEQQDNCYEIVVIMVTG